MKKYYLFIFILLLLGLSGFVLTSGTFSAPKPYFGYFPVQFSSTGVPIIDVEIDGSFYPVKVDLLSKDHVSLLSDIVESGKDESAELLAKVRLNSLIFENVPISIQTDDKVIITLRAEGKEKHVNPVGSIGRKLLKKCNWLIDLNHHVLLTTNCAKELRKRGYDLNRFVKVPFTICETGIYINMETEFGEMCFLLDTASTINLMNSSHFPGQEATFVKGPFGFPLITSSQLVIHNYDYGPCEFHLFNSVKEELTGIDGIIGANFLKKHAVYLDFSKNTAYFEKW